MSDTSIVHEPYLNPLLRQFSDPELEFEMRQRAFARIARVPGMKELVAERIAARRRVIPWNDERRYVLVHAAAMRIPNQLIADYLGLSKGVVSREIAKFLETWDVPRRKVDRRDRWMQRGDAATNYEMRNEGRCAA